MATGANASVYIVKSAPTGGIPENPKLKPLQFRSCDMRLEQQLIQSECIRGDGMQAPSTNGVPKAAGSITCELRYGEQDDLIAAALRNADWAANKVKKGDVTQRFCIFERIADTTGKQWRVYYDCVVNGMKWNTEGSNPLVVSVYDFVGVYAEYLAELPSGTTFADPVELPPMSALYGEVKVNNQPFNEITSMDVSIENGGDTRPVVGSNRSLPINFKDCVAMGNASMYYENSDLAEKAQTEERMAIEFEFSDGANAYKLTATKAKPSDVWPPISGKDDIIMPVKLNFEPDNATGTHITIERIPASLPAKGV